MATPFTVVSQTNPGLSLGTWDDTGISIPGTLRAAGISSPNNPVSALSMALVSIVSTTDIISIKLATDATNRFVVNGDGAIEWGDGSAALDTNLYRLAANTLFTDDAFFASAGLIAGGGITPYWAVDNVGVITMGDGTLARDTNLYRSAASVLATDDDFAINVAGKGLRVKEGANAKMGTLTANGATGVVVSTTAVTANSRVFLSITASAGTPAMVWVSARTAGTSFTVTSVAGNTSTVAWMLVEPA